MVALDSADLSNVSFVIENRIFIILFLSNTIISYIDKNNIDRVIKASNSIRLAETTFSRETMAFLNKNISSN